MAALSNKALHDTVRLWNSKCRLRGSCHNHRFEVMILDILIAALHQLTYLTIYVIVLDSSLIGALQPPFFNDLRLWCSRDLLLKCLTAVPQPPFEFHTVAVSWRIITTFYSVLRLTHLFKRL